MHVLVTGFTPFHNSDCNASWEAVRRLPDHIGQARITVAQIPTVFQQSLAEIERLITQHQPDVVLNVGQAEGNAVIAIERVGINLDDARIPDNQQQQPVDQAIVPDGPAAYFSTLPAKAILAHLQQHGIPAKLSHSAGTYVCNHVLYGVSHYCHTQYPHMKNGFIHVPACPEQVVTMPHIPSMATETTTRGLILAIEAIVSHHDKPDLTIVGGSLH